MGEKFCLKWNDFQSTVSNSFKTLRQDEDFFDVTLVSDDEVQMSAHKLILSACSSFFKSILKKNPHQHPLIYLSGVNSANLGYILNYIYMGEVMLYQDNLDHFLEMAQQLKISGLINQNQEIGDKTAEESYKNDYYSPTVNQYDIDQREEDRKFEKEDLPVVAIKRQYTKREEPVKEVAEAINNLIIWENEAYTCKTCGKGDKRLQNMKKHVEIHIDGISYDCPLCDKTFRSKNSFNFHKYRRHN